MGASDFSSLPHIGEALRRKEDYRFLTGAGNYTDDITLANQSHAVFVRSPHAHAAIKSIDIAEADGTMHPMQAAFKECHGLQCGFCTPGMVMSAIDLCTHHPKSSESEIRELLDGNLCRCTGYQNIVKAVKMGGEAMASGTPVKTTATA